MAFSSWNVTPIKEACKINLPSNQLKGKKLWSTYGIISKIPSSFLSHISTAHVFGKIRSALHRNICIVRKKSGKVYHFQRELSCVSGL